jgi:hypothetical protein
LTTWLLRAAAAAAELVESVLAVAVAAVTENLVLKH